MRNFGKENRKRRKEKWVKGYRGNIYNKDVEEVKEEERIAILIL